MIGYALAYGDKLIGYSTRNRGQYKYLGAYTPGQDANYYDEIIIGFYKSENEAEFTMGMDGWWEWAKEKINSGELKIDDVAHFNPDDVRIIEVEFKL